MLTSMTENQENLVGALYTAFVRLALSLFSEPYFYPNYSSPFAPEQYTYITYQEFQNVYVYDERTLWVAYGIGLFFALLAVIAIHQNRSSYSRDFSTTLRLGQTAEISVEIYAQDGSGCDPLPEYLEHARVTIPQSRIPEEDGLLRQKVERSEEEGLVAEPSDGIGVVADPAQGAGLQVPERVVGDHAIPRRPVAPNP